MHLSRKSLSFKILFGPSLICLVAAMELGILLALATPSSGLLFDSTFVSPLARLIWLKAMASAEFRAFLCMVFA